MSHSKSQHELIVFIREFTGRAASGISRESRMREDLGIYGDDAVDFFVAFADRFNVDLSTFKIEDYFEGEGYPDLQTAKALLRQEPRPVYQSLNVGQLLEAIRRGRWQAI